jgi:ATP/maltotriose-dependent transcriptional regulator MalT
VHRAVVLDRSGVLADAEREATRAYAELAGSHVPNAAAALAVVGDVRRRLGDLDGAEQAFARAEQLAGRTCVGAALLRLAQGRLDDVQRIIAGCLDGQPLDRPAHAFGLAAAVQVAVAAGDTAAAGSRVQALERLATIYDSTLFQPAHAPDADHLL